MLTSMTDVTSDYIVNSSFEADGRTLNQQAPQGWTVNSQTAWWGVNKSGGNEDPAATDGQYLFGVWDNSITMHPVISQTISSLPKGTYRLSVDMQASNRSANTLRLGRQRLFAGNREVLFCDQLPTAGMGDVYPMQPLTLDFEVSTPQAITIGVTTSDAPAETWFKIDNFRLYRLSTEEFIPTAIETIPILRKSSLTTDAIYSISGQRLSSLPNHHSIYIKNGKKIMR